MSLSDKIEPEGSKYYWNDRFIFVEDVKEFIKKLKERFEEGYMCNSNHIKDIIDEEAGKELVEEQE